MRTPPVFLLVLGCAVVFGCVHQHRRVSLPFPAAKSESVVHAKHGPPPHAPAHGYRHKHAAHGVELVFDTKLGVYTVSGRSAHYFTDGHYYRLHDGVWSVSVKLGSGWARIADHRLPKGLRPAKAAKHKHKRGPVPAKHAR